jgi:hypothetical protein
MSRRRSERDDANSHSSRRNTGAKGVSRKSGVRRSRQQGSSAKGSYDNIAVLSQRDHRGESVESTSSQLKGDNSNSSASSSSSSKRAKNKSEQQASTETPLHRQLRIIASYSPLAVAIPCLLSHLAPTRSRFQAHTKPFFGCVLISDISGFTPLTESLVHTDAVDASAKTQKQRTGANRLVAIINSIFSRLINVVRAHGGDVLKFAGDALLSVWRASNDSLEERRRCVQVAAMASLAMNEAMRDFTAMGVRMRLHSGMASGQLRGVHFGGVKNRWEYVVVGDALSCCGTFYAASQRSIVLDSFLFLCHLVFLYLALNANLTRYPSLVATAHCCRRRAGRCAARRDRRARVRVGAAQRHRHRRRRRQTINIREMAAQERRLGDGGDDGG